MQPIVRAISIVLTLSLFVGGCSHTPSGTQRPDFRAALDRHIDAIGQRDLATLTDTLTRTDDLMVIFPAGQTLPTTSDVVRFHREWFDDKKWVFSPEVVKVIEGSDLSTALLRYDYRDTPDGAPRSSWLVLVFALEDGQWRLVHDQNTRIDAASPEA